MGKYTVEIIPKAEKEYLKLPEKTKALISKKIFSLDENPRPFGANKLKNTDYYRIRIGDFRAIYSIDEASKKVKVLSIAHRKEVYR